MTDIIVGTRDYIIKNMTPNVEHNLTKPKIHTTYFSAIHSFCAKFKINEENKFYWIHEYYDEGIKKDFPYVIKFYIN